MSKQWGHGYHTGHAQGQEIGELLGAGQRECEFGLLSDRLKLLSDVLKYYAEDKNGKSPVWWSVHAAVIAKEMNDIASRLPSVLANILEQPPN